MVTSAAATKVPEYYTFQWCWHGLGHGFGRASLCFDMVFAWCCYGFGHGFTMVLLYVDVALA